MAKNSISDYDTTAANNTDIQSTDISEGCPASGINNAIREMMADTADAFTQGTPIALDQTNNRVGIGTTAGDAGASLTINKSPVAAHGNPLVQVGGSTFTSGGYYTVGLGYTNSTYTEPPAEIAYVSKSDSGGTKGDIVFGTRDVTTNTAVSTRMTITADGNVGIGAAPNATFGSTLYVQDAPAANKPILSVYSQGNSNNAGIAIFNDTGNRGIWTEGSNMRFTRTYEGNSTADMTINSSGNLLLGTTSDISAGQRLAVKYSYTNPGAAWESDNVNVHNAIVFKNPNGTVGTIRTAASGVQYNTSSDHRLKENVADMTGAIARMKQLAPKRFNFIADDTVTVDGFLAHEAQAVVPEAVSGTHNEVDDDGNAVMQGIDQSKLVPLLTGALQEAIAKIETLETEMTALKARVTALEA